MYDYQMEEKVNSILALVNNETKLTKQDAESKIRAYLTDYSCETVIIKVSDSFKASWYKINEAKLKEEYQETCLGLETLYIANIYQGAWLPNCPYRSIYAQSLGQLLRGDNTIENIVDYPIEWMVVAD